MTDAALGSRRRFLAGMVAVVALAACARAGDAKRPDVEMRLVAESEAPDVDSVPSWDEEESPYLLERAVVARTRDLSFVERKEGGYHVQLAPAAAERFEDVTSRSLGRKMALVLDGRVMIAPTIKTKIVGGSIYLTSRDPEVLSRLDRLTG